VLMAKTLQKEGVSFFPLRADPDANTYYVGQHKTTMLREDFEIEGCNSVDKLEQALVELWISQGYSQLTVLAPTLCKLAELCHLVEVEEEQKWEVSPEMYVLF